ncbi:MAG: T3SS (YopN, CesT) and YbjN peptide-binding chaperone 1 [Nitriliruptoraceae bacterium]
MGDGTARGGTTADGGDAAGRLRAVLARLGVGEGLRLRHGPGADGGGAVLGEVHARPDGTLEVPGALVGGGDAYELFGRDRVTALAAAVVAARPDLDVARATIVDAAGVERTLDGAEVVVGDDDPARFDETLPQKVRRFLAGRTGAPMRAFTPDADGAIMLVLRGGTVLLQPLRDERQLLVRTPLVTDVAPDPALDPALGRLGAGRLLRFLAVEGTVWAEAVLPAWPFVGAHLDQVLTELDRNVLDLVAGIHRTFGGERQYPEGGGSAHDQRGDGGAGDGDDDPRGEEQA